MYHTNSKYAKTHDRYLYQGQEMDDEVKGEGNSVNYSFRMHDPRLGRFFAIDPVAGKYSHNSPYAFSENRVIDGIDLEGLEFFFSSDGRLLGQIGNSTKVYVVTNEDDVKDVEQKIKWANHQIKIKGQWVKTNTDYCTNRATDTGMSYADFIFSAEVLYAESSNSGSVDEVAGIYSVLENRAKYEGTTVKEQMTNEKGIRGAKIEARKRYTSEQGLAADEKRKTVRAGLIRAVLEEKDYSNGAFYWDGTDLKNTSRYSTSYMFTDKSHDIYNLGSKYKSETGLDNTSWKYRYQSTAAIGKTTFSKLNPVYRDGQYPDKKDGDNIGKRFSKEVGAGYTSK
jgi:RHS repeat-associated protein